MACATRGASSASTARAPTCARGRWRSSRSASRAGRPTRTSVAQLYDTILYAVDEHVATITLNRPDKRNAYVPQMGEDLVAAFRAARDDDAVRAVILTGAGQGFC